MSHCEDERLQRTVLFQNQLEQDEVFEQKQQIEKNKKSFDLFSRKYHGSN